MPQLASPAALAPAAASDVGGMSGIEAEPLAPVDASWAGTLSAGDHALPRDMWSGTSRAFVAAALPLLQPTTSPELQNLARRLLLSDAVAPAGQDPANGPSLFTLRLDRVLALGDMAGAALIDMAPRNVASETFDRDSVELRIADGQLAAACQEIKDRVGLYRNEWWNEALVGCQALTGAYDQASLGLSAMRDRKATRDPAFDVLIEGIFGHRHRLHNLPDPGPLRMALLAAAKLPLPAEALAAAGPAALSVWATSNKVPAEERLAAAEKAEAFGALPPAGLGVLYGAVKARPTEDGALLKSGNPPDDPRSRAILYDLARTSEPGARGVAALKRLVEDARRRGVLVPMARLLAPLVRELQPTPDEQSFARDAARVLLAAGDRGDAMPWVDLADRPALRVVADFTRPATPGADDPPPFAAAVAALRARDSTAGPRQADLLLSLAAALGEPVDAIDLAGLLEPPHRGVLPNGALWRDQQQAAKAGRVGEAVLTTLLIASADGRLSSEPIVLAHAISGLEAVGLDADARALAVEAALDAGI